jgi:hypothetical protein
MMLRRMPLILALAAELVLAALGWLVPLSRNSQAAPAPSSDAAFKGKRLLVSTTMMSTFLLEKAQVQKIGDHSFLVGKGKEEGRIGGWYKDRTVRLQMEHVVSITEFDDLKDAKKALESGGGTIMYPGVPLEAAPAGETLTPPTTPPVRDRPRKQP